jgi:PhnB protein
MPNDAKSPPAVSPVPPARGALPYLTAKGASEAIAFYQQVFGAEQCFRIDDPDGAVMHAELAVGPAHFMITEERPQYGSLGPKTIGGSAVTLVVYVPDVDAVVAKALKAGATPTMPVENQFWGDRAGGVVDPYGHQWMVATQVEALTPEEVTRRSQAMFSRGA